LKLGIEVAQSTVAKYMAKRRPGSGQTWKTFLRNHVAGIGAMDFLVVPTINFRLLFVLVILRHERRRLISLSVTNHQTAEWIHRDLRRRSVMSRYAPARLEMSADKLGQPPARPTPTYPIVATEKVVPEWLRGSCRGSFAMAGSACTPSTL
jgi:hypothetical protein